jgi:hypothetical protein
VLKGRVTALTSVVVLVALSVGAAALSLTTGGPTRATAAGTLREAVDATLASRSFTINITDLEFGIRGTEIFVYEAPDRCEYTFYSNPTQVGREEPYRVLQTVAIARSEYWRNDASRLWNSAELAERSFCANWQAIWLTPLLEGSRVSRSSHTYRSYAPPYVVQRSFGPTGEYSEVATAVLRHGKVVFEDIVTSLVNSRDRMHDTVVAQEQVTIGAFGTSVPVVAPPASQVSGG